MWNTTVPSWSVDRHQSRENRTAVPLSTGVWVYIENNGSCCFDVHVTAHSVSGKVCFGTFCWALPVMSLSFLFAGNKFEIFSVPVAKLNSCRSGCWSNLFLSVESCPPWLLDGLVALLHTIWAPIIKWLAQASMWRLGTLQPGFFRLFALLIDMSVALVWLHHWGAHWFFCCCCCLSFLHFPADSNHSRQTFWKEQSFYWFCRARARYSNWRKWSRAHIDQVKEDASIMFLIKRQKNERTSLL